MEVVGYKTIEEGKFKYLETNPGGEVILLLHGLMGQLSNFSGIVQHFGKKYNVVVPILPILELPIVKVSLDNLVKFIESFVTHKGFDKYHLLGNSLGGHLAQLYTLKNPSHILSVTLTGSSGLFEKAMGSSFPKRGSMEYVTEKVRSTFYDPDIASEDLIDDVYAMINNRENALRIVMIAKSAIRNNLESKIQDIKAPTLLVWGKNDEITPPFVGEKFHELLPNSRLEFIDKCGHAPMMEHPELFNNMLNSFLEDIKKEGLA